MGAARLDFMRMPDVRFWKLCGSGSGEGFTPLPNTRVWAILAVWDDEDSARRGCDAAPVYRRWRNRASESWTVFLSASASRGAWSGAQPFEPDERMASQASDAPLAALTRATIRLGALPRFWGREPEISKAIGADPNVIFKIGIGEVPWLHQVTFSVWPDAESMAAFARKDGPHAQAIRAVRDGGWFREELYARFRVLGGVGSWNGRDPIQLMERRAA